MTETIPIKKINNRQLVIEIRFNAVPSFIDKRGAIINDLVKSKLISNPTWELGDGVIQYSDSKNSDQLNGIRCIIDIQRFIFTDVSAPSNDSFYKNFEKAYAIFRKHIPENDTELARIGCRIVGTYTGTSNSYDSILRGFKKTFPTNFFFEDFPVKDLSLKIVYQNGMYEIGPIREKDEWTKKHFPNSDLRKDLSGFGIDTDNYIILSPNAKVKDSSIKDVFITTLSVEKLLFEKLSEI